MPCMDYFGTSEIDSSCEPVGHMGVMAALCGSFRCISMMASIMLIFWSHACK